MTRTIAHKLSGLAGAATLAWLMSTTPAFAQSADAQPAHLPTPYTADQIRGEWEKGFWVETEVRTAQGNQRSRMHVVAWSQAGSEMVEYPVKDDGSLGAAGPSSTTTWEELRTHALFPADRASRERTQRDSVFGKIDGWLYTVRGEHGTVSEFFFADDLPGSPVYFRQLQGDQELFVAEQTGRGVNVTLLSEQ